MSDNIRRDTLLRFILVFGILTLFAVTIWVWIIYMQTSKEMRHRHDIVRATQERSDKVLEPIRGNIIDSEGRLLASSMPEYNVFMDTRVENLHRKKDSAYLRYADSIADGLSKIVTEYSAAKYREKMDYAFRSKIQTERYFKICPRSVNFIELQQIKELPLVRDGVYKSGFYFTPLHRRNHPYQGLGLSTVGSIYGDGGSGKRGLEARFDEELKGVNGVERKVKVGGAWEDIPVKDAQDGYTVVSTLDANLLDICDKALRERLKITNGEWGCCILMETRTGKLKAICNLDRNEDGTYSEMKNHSVIRVEPGSVFKTISMMAALDDGKIGLYDTVSVSKKSWVYQSLSHTDAHPKDTVYTMRSALAVSSNIAFAKMVLRCYEGKAKKFVDKLQKMGVCDGFECEIPGAQNPLITVPDNDVTMSKMSYGYSVEMSPIQIVAFYNSIANNGRMVRPYLVERIEEDGEVLQEWDTEVIKANICRQSVLKDVKYALHDVVWDNKLGTASIRQYDKRTKAQSPIVSIAGKTGTAQLLINGAYKKVHRITFVGYFPEEEPEYTCLCMINHPQGGYDAGMDCGRVVREIAEKTMAYTGEYIYDNGQWVWQRRNNNKQHKTKILQ